LEKWDILGLGAVAVDDLIYVDSYPAVDTKVPVVRRARLPGGLSGNALTAAALLGGRTAYLGVLNKDELSNFLIEELKRVGIDCSQVIFDKEAHPIHSTIIVEIPTGSRTIFFDLSGFKQPPCEKIFPELITRCRVLLIDHTVLSAAIEAGKQAHVAGIPVVADIEPSNLNQLDAFLDQVDHLVIGVEMGRQLTGEAMPEKIIGKLQRSNFLAVVITDGRNGCYFSQEGGPIYHQSALAIKTIDTIGCGDIFHGAYALGIAWGMSVTDSVRIATITAGIKASHPLGAAGIPGWSNVVNRLSELPNARVV
jgi:sugar/nucleoside kinase (ribokinase family)